MESFRLKLKVGQHEFEAEGDQETVAAQLAIWKELIAGPSGQTPIAPTLPSATANGPAMVAPITTESTPAAATSSANGDIPRVDLDKLFQQDGRLVYLTALPTGERRIADAAMLLLLGQRVYNSTDLVTGSQILDGLERSGLGTFERADGTLGDYVEPQKYVIRSGVRRGVKYRLTPPGLAKAKEIAKELLKMVG